MLEGIIHEQKEPQIRGGPAPGHHHLRTQFARAYERLSYTAPSAVLRVRVAAIVIAVVALAAAVEWALRLQADYSPATVAGIVLLAFLAGLAAVTAFRTEAIMKRLSQARKR